jgi:hypothetical protein
MNVHRADVTVRLTDSALPQVNGATAVPPEHYYTIAAWPDPAALIREDGYLAEGRGKFTDDATAKPQSRSNGGIITITQELPWRTEVCAIFGNVQMSKV